MMMKASSKRPSFAAEVPTVEVGGADGTSKFVMNGNLVARGPWPPMPAALERRNFLTGSLLYGSERPNVGPEREFGYRQYDRRAASPAPRHPSPLIPLSRDTHLFASYAEDDASSPRRAFPEKRRLRLSPRLASTGAGASSFAFVSSRSASTSWLRSISTSATASACAGGAMLSGADGPLLRW